MSYLETEKHLAETFDKKIEELGDSASVSPVRFDVCKLLFKVENSQGGIIQESSDPQKPFHVKVGDLDMMKGMSLALTTMKVGEKSVFVIPKELSKTRLDQDDTNQIEELEEEEGDDDTERKSGQVRLTINLLDIERGVKVTKWDLEEEEKLPFATKTKEEGNQLLKSGKWEEAEEKYSQVVELVEWDQSPRRKNLKIGTLYNISLVLANQKKFVSALEKINWAINMKPEAAKGYFRRATIYQKMEEFERALQELQKALDIEPENPDIQSQIQLVKDDIQKYYKNSSKLYNRIFEKGVYESRASCVYSDNLNPLVECEFHYKEALLCAKIELFSNVLPDTCNVFESFVKEGKVSRYRSSTVISKNYILFDLADDPSEETEEAKKFKPENKSTKIKDGGFLYFVPDSDGNCSTQIGLSLAPLPWFDGIAVPFGFVVIPTDFISRFSPVVDKMVKACEKSEIKIRSCKMF